MVACSLESETPSDEEGNSGDCSRNDEISNDLHPLRQGWLDHREQEARSYETKERNPKRKMSREPGNSQPSLIGPFAWVPPLPRDSSHGSPFACE